MTRQRVHGELDVGTAGLHSYASNAGERGVAHLLVLDVGQGLRWGHGDGVAGVDSHRVEVLDGADHYAVVGVVTHDFEFVLLLTCDGALDEHLADGRGIETLGGQLDQRFGVLGDAGAGSSQDVARAHHDRVADRLADGHGLVEGVGEARCRDRQADLLHSGLELLTVLGRGDGLGIGSDDLDIVGRKDTSLEQCHGQVEGRLAAQSGQQGVGPLSLDDGGQHVGVEGLDVGPIRHAWVGHDRGRVRVGQHHPVALFGQHATGLGPRVVELTGLADHDRARADDQDRLEIVAARHQRTCPSGPPLASAPLGPPLASAPLGPPLASISILNSSKR